MSLLRPRRSWGTVWRLVNVQELRSNSLMGAALFLTPYYDPVNGNTGRTLLVKDGSESNDVPVRLPASQTGALDTVIQDVRFEF